ncbi:toprim domain-containing protein [Fusobacterium polymorphum]|uniref:DNA primase n=2 Tax=Fusobacterium nucleatum subsp. polymorphum TaxID=76857 RepID=A0A2C6BGU4_FUSNP|nr:JAB domain-containing protein [Fusobacterium polymorphum]PHI03787.1 DNA primase [Fusobacterium polymorphum]PHI16130.1 DNA primase [Fusobacterium polymorphum]
MEKEPTIEELKNFLGEYLELKGINTSSVFRCFSPTHEDKHPSMSFYKKGNICNCFACGEKYNIFSLVGMEYNLKGFKEQKEKVIELYKNKKLIQDVNATIYSKKNTKVELESAPQQKETKERKHPELDYYYLECKKRISETDYLQRRGISIEVQDRYNIGYDPNFKNNTWKAIIIPTTHYSFTARNTDINSEDRLRKVGKSEIFNYWELEQNKKEFFYIVEGEIDALSVAEVGKKAIALGSVNNINLFINKLKNDLPGNKFYLMLDNDEQGIKAQEELYNKMKELNLNIENTKILDKYKDPNEFLVADRNNFIKALNELEINKVITVEVDKLYSYDLENKQLIKEAPFNDIGLAEVYEASQELYKNNIGKNIAILGVNDVGEIFFKKTKDIDFNSTKEGYVTTYNIFERENATFKGLADFEKERYLKNIREVDAKLNINFEELVYKVNGLELEKTDIPISLENKNIENDEKKTKNLYEYFNCSSKEELYKLVKNRDPSVKELLNYFKYAIKEKDISEKKIKLLNNNQTMEYFKKNNFPEKNYISILVLDSGLKLLKDVQVHKDTPFPEVFKEFYSPKAMNYITLSSDEHEYEKGNIRYKLDSLGYTCLTNFYTYNSQNPKNIVLENSRNGIIDGNEEINRNSSSLNPRKEKNINYEQENAHDLVKMQGFDEFTKYITEKELVGLNVIKDEKKIKQLLKIGNQELSYENFKILKYDKGYNISEVVTIGQGGVNYAKVDPKHIYPHLLDEKLKGIILCHNHPSGAVSPSRADDDITESIRKKAILFDKEVLDHLIVGKEGVYKYSENDLIFMDEVKKAKEYLETHKTYNCLTGEAINIQTHSSGENKWIGKKDVERYGIEKLEGAKETIGKITYIENNKLYQKPVSYYNLSDLKITKEIEQKLVPMKEKEKTQEISKSKGQGIGD